MYKPLNILIVFTCLLNFGNSLSEFTLSDSTTEVSRVNTTGEERGYKYLPVKSGAKRISFKVRADQLVHLMLTDVENSMAPEVLEIIIDYYGSQTIFRQRSSQATVKAVIMPKNLNANEYRGFWVQWTDDNWFSVGREHETEPFIKYQSKLPLSVKYLGYISWLCPGSWIFYGDFGANTNQISTTTNVVSEGIRFSTTGSEQVYKYTQVPSGMKRIVFQVRADKLVHLMLSGAENSMTPEVLEILIDFNGQAVFRQKSTQTILKAVNTPKYLDANEYRGFWVQWTDGNLISVGREFDIQPFIEYQSNLALSVKYFGVQTWLTPGAWIIYATSAVNTNQISSSNIPSEVIRVNTTGQEQAYKFYPVKSGSKCYSFQVRAEKFVHLMLTDVENSVAPEVLEIVIDYHDSQTIFRQRSSQAIVKALVMPKNLNANEYRGFWVQWTDDNWFLVGRESETEPFIKYQSKLPLSVKHIGIISWLTPGSWILYGDQKCPAVSATPAPV